MRTLGQLNYDTYRAAVGGQTFDNKPLPSFEDLGKRQQDGWQASAEAIVKEFDRDNVRRRKK